MLTNQRRRSNHISQIKDVRGVIWESQDDIGKAFVNYFSNLFTSDSTDNMEDCLRAVKRQVTTEMNTQLLKKFTIEEIGEALNQMPPLKVPGLMAMQLASSSKIGQQWALRLLVLYLVF